MSGCSWEYTMSNMAWINGQPTSGYSTSSNNNSAFTAVLFGGTSFTGTYAFPSKRYYDKYSYGASNTEYTRGKLGDATKEMAPSGPIGNWYGDYANLPHDSNSWVIRSGYYNNDTRVGAFNFAEGYGSTGINISARAVLLGTGA